MKFARLSMLFLALGLSGCFTSEVPLITPDIADYPFAAKTAYVKISLDDGKPDADQIGTLTLNEQHYMRAEDGEKPAPVLFKKIDGEFYAAQQFAIEDDGKPGPFFYDLARISGKTLTLYGMECGDEERARYAASGDVTISKDKNDGCSVQSLASLTKILRGAIDAEPKPSSRYRVQD
jgi:hypothetical protein